MVRRSARSVRARWVVFPGGASIPTMRIWRRGRARIRRGGRALESAALIPFRLDHAAAESQRYNTALLPMHPPTRRRREHRNHDGRNPVNDALRIAATVRYA